MDGEFIDPINHSVEQPGRPRVQQKPAAKVCTADIFITKRLIDFSDFSSKGDANMSMLQQNNSLGSAHGTGQR